MRKKRNLDLRISESDENLIGRLFSPNLSALILSKELTVTAQPSSNFSKLLTEKLDLKEIFGNDNEIHLEIGAGKGGFIVETARQNPDVNFIALEKTPNVVVTALENLKKQEVKNVRFIIGDAEYLGYIIPEKSIGRIYLNFSCPYPKGSYASRRLTHKRFLDIYDKILIDRPNENEEALIFQKTDSMPFFEFSKASYLENGFKIIKISEDLHNSDIKNSVITEYEDHFSKMGKPIYFISAKNK